MGWYVDSISKLGQNANGVGVITIAEIDGVVRRIPLIMK